ncbi:nuclease-related domain-containing protein [Bacillus sp. KH172YL63]|uniref:nuclease-related domain-containing protein n=1 Tax=Bacillus sp. KH172YL63 TaxID=2709784 RepID=UPI0013E480B1|nr:nuclease-related domain-containing protein [Bacillus sp. KH172YL63]BCB02089.1 nuclease [Bacillus sp. KH172YL63]
MFCKDLQIPLSIEKNQALLWRLPLHHQKYPVVEKDLKKKKAGYNGESTVYYHLSFLKDKRYKIFHNVRLPLFSKYFQIDFLILTPAYILLIEVKNISGMVSIDPFIKQLTRTRNGVAEGFNDPVSQVQRQKLLLQKWFSVQKLKHPPIEHLVVFSHPSTILNYAKTPPKDSPYRNIIHAQNIIDKIKEVNNALSKEVLSDREVNRIKKLILKSHMENELDVELTYGITKTDIITGVRCEHCEHIPMTRVYASWRCGKCERFGKYAHHQAIRDYFLLINKNITNRELRDFLHLSSRTTAYKMLKEFKMEGERKAAFYYNPQK